MDLYIPICHAYRNDGKEREDQETWDLVGCDPTLIKLRSAVNDVDYHLGSRTTRSLNIVISKLEETLYDKLSYD